MPGPTSHGLHKEPSTAVPRPASVPGRHGPGRVDVAYGEGGKYPGAAGLIAGPMGHWGAKQSQKSRIASALYLQPHQVLDTQ